MPEKASSLLFARLVIAEPLPRDLWRSRRFDRHYAFSILQDISTDVSIQQIRSLEFSAAVSPLEVDSHVVSFSGRDLPALIKLFPSLEQPTQQISIAAPASPAPPCCTGPDGYCTAEWQYCFDLTPTATPPEPAPLSASLSPDSRRSGPDPTTTTSTTTTAQPDLPTHSATAPALADSSFFQRCTRPSLSAKRTLSVRPLVFSTFDEDPVPFFEESQCKRRHTTLEPFSFGDHGFIVPARTCKKQSLTSKALPLSANPFSGLSCEPD